MKRALLLGVLMACHGSDAAKTKSGSACSGKLDELARFYEAAAADNASATRRMALHDPARDAGVHRLPEVAGAAADLSKADVLLVGPDEGALVTAAGDTRPFHGDDFFPDAPDKTRQLVIEIDERVPWQRVEQIRQRLSYGTPYASIAVAYSTRGALAAQAAEGPG